MPPNRPEDYLDSQIQTQLSPESFAPPSTVGDFMRGPAQKPSFGEDEGAELEYYQGLDKAKRQMSRGLAMTGGDAAANPQRAYEAAVLNAGSAFEPRYAYDLRNTFQEWMRDNAPAAFDQMEQDRREQEEVQRRGLGPATESVRQSLILPESRMEMDRRRDVELLDQVLPQPQMDTLAGQQPLPAPQQQPASPVMPTGPQAPAGVVPQVEPTAPTEQVDTEQAVEAETTFGPGTSDTFREWVTLGGNPDDIEGFREFKTLSDSAKALGTDLYSKESQQRAREFANTLESQGMSRLRFVGQQNKIMRNPEKAEVYSGLSDAEKVSYIKLQDSLNKISGRTDSFGRRTETDRRGNETTTLTEEGARMEALKGLESAIQAGEFTYEDLNRFNVLNPENDRQALNKDGYDAMVLEKARNKELKEAKIVELTAPDGTKHNALMQPDGKASFVGGKKDKLEPGGYNTAGTDLMVVNPDGTTTPYPKEDHWLGSDGIVRKRKPIVEKVENTRTGLEENVIVGYHPPNPPPGVKDVTFAEGRDQFGRVVLREDVAGQSNIPQDQLEEARKWLADNPNDPRAPQVRARLGL